MRDLSKPMTDQVGDFFDRHGFPMPVFACECCRKKDAVITFTVGTEHVDLCNGCAKLVWEACVKNFGSFPEQTEVQLGLDLPPFRGVN